MSIRVCSWIWHVTLFNKLTHLRMTFNMTQSFADNEEHNTYTQLVAFYLAARLKGVVYYLMTGFLLPMIRGVMLCQAMNILIPAAIWIGSIYVDMPGRLGLVWTALFLDMYGQTFIIALFRYGGSHGEDSPLGRVLSRFFEFYPAMNIEHKVERTNAFVSLVLGYSIVGIIFQSNGGDAFNAFVGKAVLGLIQAFFYNWIYFDIDASNIHVHAIRRSVASGQISSPTR